MTCSQYDAKFGDDAAYCYFSRNPLGELGYGVIQVQYLNIPVPLLSIITTGGMPQIAWTELTVV